MNNLRNIVTIENGGGNQEDIYHILDFKFRWSQYFEDADKRHRNLNCRDALWGALNSGKLYCEKFYDENGTKIVKHIKKFILENGMTKEEVAEVWPQVVAMIGDLYLKIKAEAEMKPDYFGSNQFGKFGDDDSCFQHGGCNEYNGVFLDVSPACGTILVRPTVPDDIPDEQKRSRYGKGRMICYIENSTTAWLLNNYTQHSHREIPRNIFVRALEALSGAKIEYNHISRGDCEIIPIFPNHAPYKCTAVKGNFDRLTTDYRFGCPTCGNKFDPTTAHTGVDGNTYMIGCSDSCMWEQVEGERHHCTHCDSAIPEDEVYWIDGDVYCEDCYNEHFFFCECCEHDRAQDGSVEVEGFNGLNGYMCERCASSHTIECTDCGALIYEKATDYYAEDQDGNPYCNDCGVPEEEEEETG